MFGRTVVGRVLPTRTGSRSRRTISLEPIPTTHLPVPRMGVGEREEGKGGVDDMRVSEDSGVSVSDL